MATIEIRNLSKVFGSDPAPALAMLERGAGKDEIFKKTGLAVGLANVSFDVEDGEILVVMGLSGSGKSTLVRCINRLIEPTAGKVVVQGTDVATLGRDRLLEFRRSHFGMVFQHFALLPHRSVIANVEYGLEIQDRDPAERREKAQEALRLVGLEGWEDASPSQLSGGMQQRVGLARALAVDPPIMLMDEAFSALDPLIRRDMQHELVSLQERMHKTIVFVSHDLDEAIKIGDRIVLMKDGSVIQVGTPEEILTSPATEYVARFVEDVDMSKVLTARSVMTRARVVAYRGDGPRTVLHKLRDENYSAIFAVERDYRLLGLVGVDDVEGALKRGDRDISSIIEPDVPRVSPETPLTDLFPILSGWSQALPVVDEADRLAGVVVKASVLEALARGAHAAPEESPPPESGAVPDELDAAAAAREAS
jgi:glycine betaine/proline transport system ATP-binding protein